MNKISDAPNKEKKTAQHLVMHAHDGVIINSQRGFKELKSFPFVFGDFFPQTASFSLTCVRADEKKVDVLKTLSQKAKAYVLGGNIIFLMKDSSR